MTFSTVTRLQYFLCQAFNFMWNDTRFVRPSVDFDKNQIQKLLSPFSWLLERKNEMDVHFQFHVQFPYMQYGNHRSLITGRF